MKLSVDSFPRKVIFVWQISDFRQTGGTSEYKIAIKKWSCEMLDSLLQTHELMLKGWTW
jgi:hypothetical protein